MGARIGGVVAAVVVLLGSFLPWLTVSVPGNSITYNGMASELGDAPLTLLGAGKSTLVAAIVIGVLVMLWKRGTVIAAAVVSMLVFVVGTWDIVDVQLAFVDSVYGPYIDPSPSIGLYMVVLGGLAGIVLALIGQAGITTRPAPFGATAYGAQQAPAWGQAPQQYAAPAQMPVQRAPAQQAPAGWLPDPYGQAQLRYWDGVRWTEHTHNR